MGDRSKRLFEASNKVYEVVTLLDELIREDLAKIDGRDEAQAEMTLWLTDKRTDVTGFATSLWLAAKRVEVYEGRDPASKLTEAHRNHTHVPLYTPSRSSK